MKINNEVLESLVVSRYKIECIQIELSPKERDDGVKLAGPGSIRQNDDGEIVVKFYHSFEDDNELYETWKAATGESHPGEIMPKDLYFSMEAIDMEGTIWKADDILVQGHFSTQVNGVIVESSIRNISSVKERASGLDHAKSFLRTIIPGSHVLPCNEWEEMTNKKTRSKCRVQCSGVEIILMIRDNFVIIEVNGQSATVEESLVIRLSEALSIIQGKLCHVLYSSYCGGEVCTTTISSINRKEPNDPIASPIKHRDPLDHASFQTFLQCYLEATSKPHDVFYEYWHRINRSWQGGLEIAALTVTTAVEGIIKDRFSDYIKPDTDFQEQAESAKEAIQAVEIGDRIREYISSSLGNACKGSPKNALRYLENKGIIDKSLIKSWNILRNKATHADSLEFNELELQKYLDLAFSCHHLFNILLLISIDFSGNYTNLSKKGWPQELMANTDFSKDLQGA